jgi:hypothetical protein
MQDAFRLQSEHTRPIPALRLLPFYNSTCILKSALGCRWWIRWARKRSRRLAGDPTTGGGGHLELDGVLEAHAALKVR